MYVYRQSESQLWTVGFYTPDGEWEPESDHTSHTEAADRVHYLNGGTAKKTHNFCPVCGENLNE